MKGLSKAPLPGIFGIGCIARPDGQAIVGMLKKSALGQAHQYEVRQFPYWPDCATGSFVGGGGDM
jgi:hypothetical protein